MQRPGAEAGFMAPLLTPSGGAGRWNHRVDAAAPAAARFRFTDAGQPQRLSSNAAAAMHDMAQFIIGRQLGHLVKADTRRSPLASAAGTQKT